MTETNLDSGLLRSLFPGFKDEEIAVISAAVGPLISEIELAEIHGVNDMPSGPLPLDEIINKYPFLIEVNGRLGERLSPLAQLRRIMSVRQQGEQRLSSDN